MSDTAFTDSTEPKLLPCLDLRPDLRQVDVYDVAQFVLRVERDADGGGVALQDEPTHALSCSDSFRDSSLSGLL